MTGLPAVQRFDLSREPHRLTPREWNQHRRRNPAEIVGVVLHQWATDVGTTIADRLRYGEPEAFARRCLATPYNICAGVTRYGGQPVVSYAQLLERYTHASDAACGHWLSIGVMGLFPFEEARRTVKHTPLTDALRAAVDDALAWAAELLDPHHPDESPLRLITHRQAINGKGDHECCPGEAVVAMACASEWVRSGTFVPEPDLALIEKWSRPWPESWRRHLFQGAPADDRHAIGERPEPPEDDLIRA